jgi:hypothetical protein
MLELDLGVAQDVGVRRCGPAGTPPSANTAVFVVGSEVDVNRSASTSAHGGGVEVDVGRSRAKVVTRRPPQFFMKIRPSILS